MKKLIATFLILFPILVSAQDILYKTDNTKQEVIVTEIFGTHIKYKLYVNQNGPVYTLSKNEIALIVYQNGTHETFKSDITKDPVAIKKEKRFTEVTQTKNIIFLNTIEFLNSGIGLSYMRQFGEGKFSLHVPFATSFNKPGLDNALSTFGGLGGCQIQKTNYDLGLGVYFNTSGKRPVTHFIGPLIRNAQYTATYYTYNPENYSGQQNTTGINETSLMLNNGFLYRITPHFNMMINIAAGTFVSRSFTNHPRDTNGSSYYYNTNRSIAFHAGFHFGYRF